MPISSPGLVNLWALLAVLLSFIVNQKTMPVIPALSTPWRRLVAYLEMYLVDHGFVRALYNNFYEIAPGVYRSSHPNPGQIRKYAKKYGLKSILNLRGMNNSGQYWLEKEVCQELGIHLEDIPSRSRGMPTEEWLHRIKQHFDTLEKPLLFHCKSGADRAGLVATLYMHLQQGQPMAEAAKQLHIKYGHIKPSKTGMLDHFVECYEQQQRRAPMPFMQWVDEVYDEQACEKDFHANWFWSILVDKVLRRE